MQLTTHRVGGKTELETILGLPYPSGMASNRGMGMARGLFGVGV